MTAKDTKGKAKLRLVPYDALVAIAEVREFGIKKYKDDHGWKGVDTLDFQEAAMRHLGKALAGQEIDEESGLPHIYHALTSLAMAVAVNNFKVKDEKKCYGPQCEWEQQF